MSSRRPVLPVLVLAIAFVASAATARAASETWSDLPVAARTAISRSIATDGADREGGLSPQTLDTIFQEAKLTTVDEGLGVSVAIFGDTVVAGAPFASPPAAYVFVKPASGWADTTTFTAKLTASDGVADDNFGDSVAILDDTIVVGAPQVASGSKGAAYVFVKPASGWKSTSAFTAKLTASGGSNGDAFGATVAISANTVFVAAPDAKVGANAAEGAVFVFKEPGAGWATTSTFSARLTGSDSQANDSFGSALAALGDTVVAGSPGFGSGFAAVYVFVEPASGWASTSAFDAKLTVPDSIGNVGFGQSVALSEDTIVAGAPYTRVEPNPEQGAAFVFVKPATGWTTTSAFDAELTASGSKYLGASVAVSGRTVAAGAPDNPGSSLLPGSAYVFVKPAEGWTSTSAFDAKLTASQPADAFGLSVAISDGTLAIGAYAADGGHGAVYLFGGLPAPCDPGRLCVTPVTPAPVVPVGPRR